MDSPSCVCADARLEEGYVRALRGRRAQLLLSDPPYCLLTRRRKGGDLRDPRPRKIDREPVVRFESVRDYRTFTEGWLPKALSHLDDSAFAILWTNFLGQEPLLTVAAKEGFKHLWGEFTWGKRTTERTGNEQLLRVYEIALVLSRSPLPPSSPSSPAVPWAVVGGYDDDGEATQWGEHPHHKPFSVVEPLLRTYSKPGDVVMDPFAGSGSIPMAALRLQRVPACMELVPEWADRVTQRLNGAHSR